MQGSTVKYFSGTQELENTFSIANTEFSKRFPGVKGKRFDGYQMMVGRTESGEVVPLTRTIFYKKNPSLHKCDARCRHAKGGNCECSCGGQFHGAGS